MQIRNPKSAIRNALLLFALCALPFASAHAQSTSATLSGTISDQNGAAIPGVAVTVTNVATRLKREAVTNDEGYFTAPLLPPATYTIGARRDGFAPVQINDVVLNVGDQKALKIELKAGDVNATVQVSSEAALISESPAVATTIDRQFVSNLPLNGRSFQSLLELTPGVTLFKAFNNNNGAGGQFSVNGQRTSANNFMVDGVSANTGITAGNFVGQSGSGQLPGLTALGTTQSLVAVDELQEFRVETSTYAPEFGRTPGGQISMLTRSGTKSFHGTLFEYFRNEALDANDWFANANRLHRPPERQNDFGGTFGGPVVLPRFGDGGGSSFDKLERTFFFFSYEGLRLRLPQVKVVNVPTAVTRQQMPPAFRTLFGALPLPNGIDLGNGLAQFAASYADPSQLDATALRIDHAISTRLTVFGRFNRTTSFSDTRTSSLSSIQETRQQNQSLTTGAAWIPSSRLTNDLRVNWSRTKATSLLFLDNFGGAVPPPDDALFYPPFTPQNAWFTFTTFAGAFNVGRRADSLQEQFNLVNSLTWVRGMHSVKVGVDYRRLTPIFGRAGKNSIFIAVPNLSTALASRISLGQITSGSGEIEALFTNLSAYAQDTWKATPRLTLTYGVRWELNPSPSSRNGRLPVTVADINVPEPFSLASRNTPLWKTTYNNFAPRFGLAYQVSQKAGHELLVRGGFGVFYDTGFGPSATAFDVYPNYATKIIFGVSYPLSPTDAQPPVPGTGAPNQLWIMDRHLRLPFTYGWNASIEQSLGSRQVLTVSYVGARGHRLLRMENYRARFTEFGNTRVPIFYSSNSGTSDYNALQVQFQRRLSKGLQALANYTFSKSNDTASDDFSFQSTPAPTSVITAGLDYGPSDFDVRHTFTGGITYDLPKTRGPKFVQALLNDWSIDGLARFRTAFPLNVLTTIFFPAPVGFINVRPNVVPGVPQILTGSQYPGGKRLNPAAFEAPPDGTQGNFSRNSLRGFPALQIDMTLRRQFAFGEKVKLQLRFEVFNLFNHPNFADPETALDVSSFGLSSQMLNRGLGGLNQLYQVGGPRSAQLAAKLIF